MTVAENRDANDVYLVEGSPAIRAALAAARDPRPPFAPHDDELSAPAQLAPLPGVASPSDWSGQQAPHRRFLVPGWIVRGAAGLLSGQEGVGKSLLAQQLATCSAVGMNFLGLEPVQAPALYLTCEDPADELWRRQEDINKALGLHMSGLEEHLMLCSLKGEIANEFGTFDLAGRLSISDRYRQVETAAVGFGARLIIIDNAAHVFPGNENDRHQVATFLGLLERLSEKIDGAVILLSHPNKQHAQGNKQGNEYSGSTGWSAHVRTRLFLDYAQKDAEGQILGEDGRVLRKSKANYGKKGEEITFRWHQWAFVRDTDLPVDVQGELRLVARATFENDCFLECLRQRNAERRPVSEQPSRSYAPTVFETMPEARGCTKEQLTGAMDRLFRIKAIERGFLWVQKGEGKAKHGLREVAQPIPEATADAPPTVTEEL